MKKLLITGASGFVGSHLIDYLLSLGDFDISGTYRSQKPDGEGEHLHFLEADFEKKEDVERVLNESQPDWIVHLAAQASVSQSFKDPIGTFHTNVDSELHLFQTLLEKEMLHSKILLVSSAEVYGFIKNEDIPVDEETQLRPANPYSVSKIAQDMLGFQYYISYKMPIVRVRPFNHVGPRQSPQFVVSDFAKQIAEIEKGKKEPIIKVGNLDAKRDFTDVRDMVKAYVLLLEKGEVGEVYNAGSGVARSAKEILDLLLSLSQTTITVEQDPAKMRPSDVPIIKADTTKITNATGWKAEIPFEETIKDTLEYWRQNV